MEQAVEGQNRKIKAICVKDGDTSSQTHLRNMERFFDQNFELTDEQRKRFFQSLESEDRSRQSRFELEGGPKNLRGSDPNDLED